MEVEELGTSKMKVSPLRQGEEIERNVQERVLLIITQIFISEIIYDYSHIYIHINSLLSFMFAAQF